MDSWPLFVIADYLGSVAHVSSRRHPRKMPSKENKRGGPFLIYTTQIIFCTTKYDAETKRPPQVGHNAVTTGSMPSGVALCMISRVIEHTQSQQINIGPAKHLPFEHLQSVDLPLHRTRTPRQCQARFHRLIVLPYAVGKALKRTQTTRGSSLQPRLQLVALALAHQRGKVLRQLDCLGQLGMLFLQRDNLLLVILVAVLLTLQDQPGRPANRQGRGRGLRHLGPGLARGPMARGELLRLT